MIAAVIVLFVIAIALGGYIAFDVLRGKKSVTATDTAIEHDNKEITVEEISPVPTEDEIVDKNE